MLAFVLAVVSLLSAGYALWPVFGGVSPQRLRGAPDSVLGRLRQRKQTLMDYLADVDLDHEMGKLQLVEYEAQREELEVEAARVLEHIELLERAREGANSHEQPGPRFCAMCGDGMPKGARFCPSCGEKVMA